MPLALHLLGGEAVDVRDVAARHLEYVDLAGVAGRDPDAMVRAIVGEIIHDDAAGGRVGQRDAAHRRR
jgi:hypothetical protein